MEIKAYKCNYCGSVNEYRLGYNRCMRNCAKAKREKLKEEQLRNNFIEIADSIRLSITSIHQLAPEIINWFKKYYNRDLQLQITDLRFREVSNAYEAPIEGVVNWEQKENKPKSYLGWTGKISGQSDIWEKPIKHLLTGRELRCISDCFSRYEGSLIRGVKTGTGGGGNKFSYEVILFLNDFPKVKEIYGTYAELKEKNNLRNQKARDLDYNAKEKLINGNEQIQDFNRYDEILKHLTKKNTENKSKKINEIFNSKEWYDAIAVPKEYEFDTKTYNELLSQFGV